MSENLNFTFYSVLKNEDAYPYIGSNFLVAADGLGGAGGYKHKLEEKDRAKINRNTLFNDIPFEDIRDEKFLAYIDDLVKPLQDDKDDNSALWASRVVIGRVVYALEANNIVYKKVEEAKEDTSVEEVKVETNESNLENNVTSETEDTNITSKVTEEAKEVASENLPIEDRHLHLEDEKVREDLTNYVLKGLKDVAKEFNLKRGETDGNILLPTTLVFARYGESDEKVSVETVWAGDSRLYALTPSGLKALSKDDEDKSGSITNLFYADYKDEKKPHLNYLRHEIEKPCVLMAVSDGIFDPFEPHDHLGVEYTLLSKIEESNSIEQVRDSLLEFFNKVRQDDATMAFMAFGFDSFDDMKARFKERTDKVKVIYERKKELNVILEVMKQYESEDPMHYIKTRSRDKFDYIAPLLLNAIKSDSNDFVVTPELKNLVNDAKKEHDESFRKFQERNRNEFFTFLDELPNKVEYSLESVRGYFKNLKSVDMENKKEVAIYTLFELAMKHDDVMPSLKQERIRLQDQIDADQNLLEEKRRELRNSCLNVEKSERISMYLRGLNNTYDYLFQYNEKIDEEVGKKANDFYEALDSDVKKNLSTVVDEACKFVKVASEKMRVRFKETLKELCSYLKDNPALIFNVLEDEVINKYKLNEVYENMNSKPTEIEDKELLAKFKNNKDTIIDNIAYSLANHCHEKSIIDSQYNVTKLEAFRTYYQYDNEEGRKTIKEFDDLLLNLDKEYESLLTGSND